MMIPRKQKFLKALALFLAFSTIQLYVQVRAAGPVAATQTQAASAPQNLGYLTTTGSRDILVDKHDAHTGATILDGAVLETKDCTSATVRWSPLDQVDLATNSIATISRSDNRLTVTLTKGCARVRVHQGGEGSIITPDGKTTPAEQPDKLNRKGAEVCYPARDKNDFDPHCGAIPPLVWIIGGAGAVATTVAVVNARGENPSTTTPFLR